MPNGESDLDTVCASNPCENEGTCHGSIDSFTCICSPGFIGDRCENVDECALDPCTNGGTCNDGNNAYICTCPSSFTGDQCEVPIAKPGKRKSGKEGFTQLMKIE